MHIYVREFIESDRKALRLLFLSSRNTAFARSPAGSRRLEDFDVSTQGEKILVALNQFEPVGFASIWEPDNFLHHLFVHPEFQGCGVGKALLNACEKYFSSAATLKCLQVNERAKKFYLSQNWFVHSEGESDDGPYFVMVQGNLPNKSLERTA